MRRILRAPFPRMPRWPPRCRRRARSHASGRRLRKPLARLPIPAPNGRSPRPRSRGCRAACADRTHCDSAVRLPSFRLLLPMPARSAPARSCSPRRGCAVAVARPHPPVARKPSHRRPGSDARTPRRRGRPVSVAVGRSVRARRSRNGPGRRPPSTMPAPAAGSPRRTSRRAGPRFRSRCGFRTTARPRRSPPRPPRPPGGTPRRRHPAAAPARTRPGCRAPGSPAAALRPGRAQQEASRRRRRRRGPRRAAQHRPVTR